MLKSGCAFPNFKPQVQGKFSSSAFELATALGDPTMIRLFLENEIRDKRHAWKKHHQKLNETL